MSTADGGIDQAGADALRTLFGLGTGLADLVADALAVIGPDGLVVWANQTCADLLALPLDELVGSDGVGRIHPDEIARALDGIAYASDFPDRTAVVPYRLRRGDGSYVPTEMKSAVLARPEGDYLLLMVRDGTTRTTLAGALASVATGEGVDVTARWLTEAVTSRFPYSGALVVVPDEDGTPVAQSRRLPEDLVALVRSTWPVAPLPPTSSDASDPDDPEGPSALPEPPWVESARTGNMVVAGSAAMPPAVRAAANRQGYVSCVTVAIADGSRGWAGLIAWFDTESTPEYEFSHALVEMVELLQLALQRRDATLGLWRAARYDSLTGLLNRAGLFEHLDPLVAGPMRGRGQSSGDPSDPDPDPESESDPGTIALLFLDLDGFKAVNDTYGHVLGDEVLREIGRRLAVALDSVVMARLGGDEFAVVVAGLPDDADEATAAAGALAERVLDATRAPIEVPDPKVPGAHVTVRLGGSVGIGFRTEGDDAARLVDRADRAMYAAKADGGGWSLVQPR